MTGRETGESAWPALPYEDWAETCRALHLWTQVIGKYRLARTPWLNHSWHATLYVNGRGFTSSLVPDAAGGVEIMLDLIDHALLGWASDGRNARFPLGPMSVADFHGQFLELLTKLGATPDFHQIPNEIPTRSSPFPRIGRRGPMTPRR